MSKRKKIDNEDNLEIVRSVALGIASVYRSVQICADDKDTARLLFMTGIAIACKQMMGPDYASLLVYLERTKDLET